MTATPLREAALAAIAARLSAQLPTVTVERARRSPVDTDADTLPLLVLHGTTWDADESSDVLATQYVIGFDIAGYATGATDLAAEQALSALHAQVVAALRAWEPGSGLVAVVEVSADFALSDAEDSAKPAGSFIASFTAQAFGSAAGPYSS